MESADSSAAVLPERLLPSPFAYTSRVMKPKIVQLRFLGHASY